MRTYLRQRTATVARRGHHAQRAHSQITRQTSQRSGAGRIRRALQRASVAWGSGTLTLLPVVAAALLPLRAPDAQATTLGYARAYDGATAADYAFGMGIAVDTSGRAYLSGGFSGTVDLDPGAGTANLTSNSGDPTNTGAFVVKLVQTAPPVNTLPAATQATTGDTLLVFSTANGNRISMADSDNGSSPPRVTLTVMSGTLSLATTAGISFTVGDGATDAAMTFSGTLTAINTAPDGLTFTPAPGGAGRATLQISTLDLIGPSGGQTVTDSITIYRRPVAVNDAYTVNDGSTLTVLVATGVLANDTDGDTPVTSLTVAVVTGRTNGALTLNPNGALTYTPKSSFAGADSFTYTATDPQGLTSNTGTVSITVSPLACGPRPGVKIINTVSGGALQATVTVNDVSGPTQNRLQTLQFGTFVNAQVTLNGQTVTSGQTVSLPANTASVNLTVRRITAGQPTNVPFTAVDNCGSWPTFVGGGTAAGF